MTRLALAAVAVVGASFVARIGRAGEHERPATPSVPGWTRVSLPPGVLASEVSRPKQATRQRLRAAIEEHLRSSAGRAIDVVVIVDADGRPLLGDAESARQARAEGRAAPAVANDLTFTYDSAIPWGGDELASVQQWVGLCYPIIRSLYGPPAFANTVNIEKAAAASFSGWYSPSINTIALNRIEGSVLCHEMVHAFRDDDMIWISMWEEGTARATEVEATARAGIPNPVDHGYDYDVHYDQLNVPLVGAVGGNLFAGWSQVLMRYQLAGYAFGKAIIEDDQYLAAFNARLYERAALEPIALADEATLLADMAAAKPTVEGLDFEQWYRRQHVLNTSPPIGDFVWLRGFGVVSVFHRDAGGQETDYAGVDVDWSAYDSTGALLDSGREATNWAGTIAPFIHLPADYAQRITMTATASPRGVPITTWSQTYSHDWGQGVFGVIVGEDSGVVTLTPVRPAGAPVTVPVARGVFEAPGLATFRGQIRYSFTGAQGTTQPVLVTKDAQRYFLQMDSVKQSPLAKCRSVTVTADAHCTAAASIDDGSFAADGVPVTLSQTPPGPYTLGSSPVTLTVTDNQGLTASCAATVTVVDQTAPALMSEASVTTLWPPLHDMLPVGLTITSLTDNCTASPIVGVSVFGNEDDETPAGGGVFSPDASELSPATLKLRSERQGGGGGRVYLIVTTATDGAGNVGSSCSTVVVPRSQSAKDVALVNAMALAAENQCAANNGAPPADFVVIGDGPVIGPKQ